jgi:predicted nucleic acid-binding Zn ribbon protein
VKRTNTILLKDLLDEIIEEYQLDGKINETRIISAWSEILGPLAKSTENIYYRNQVLFVHLTSSVIRNELLMRRSEIIRLLNEKLGKKLVTDIILR